MFKLGNVYIFCFKQSLSQIESYLLKFFILKIVFLVTLKVNNSCFKLKRELFKKDKVILFQLIALIIKQTFSQPHQLKCSKLHLKKTDGQGSVYNVMSSIPISPLKELPRIPSIASYKKKYYTKKIQDLVFFFNFNAKVLSYLKNNN